MTKIINNSFKINYCFILLKKNLYTYIYCNLLVYLLLVVYSFKISCQSQVYDLVLPVNKQNPFHLLQSVCRSALENCTASII
jgi:hypothetical protein